MCEPSRGRRGACSSRGGTEPGAHALDGGSGDVSHASSACGRAFYRWLTGGRFINTARCLSFIISETGGVWGGGSREGRGGPLEAKRLDKLKFSPLISRGGRCGAAPHCFPLSTGPSGLSVSTLRQSIGHWPTSCVSPPSNPSKGLCGAVRVGRREREKGVLETGSRWSCQLEL